MAASAGFPCAATPSCHSAVDEHPMVPTFPLDHESDDIHEIASVPSVTGAPRMSYMPSLKKWPRSFISRSEEHTSELQSLRHLVCRLLLEKKKNKPRQVHPRTPTPGPPPRTRERGTS